MSDDRLFASNNPIGRKWYFINLVILFVIITATYFLFSSTIIPNVATEDYVTIATWTMYFLMFIYFITFCALIERRLYDISGSRDKGIYKILAPILTLIGLFIIVVIVFNIWPSIPLSGREMSLPLEKFNPIAEFLSTIFGIIVIAIGLKKGKKTRS